jgi:hypothetical protein
MIRWFLEHGQLVLAVGVDRVDEVVGRDLAVDDALAHVGEGCVVRLRHPLVAVVHDEPHVVVAWGPLLDLAAVSSVEPSSTTTTSSTSG